MKIIHVIGDFLPDQLGGTQLHVRDLCRAQQAGDHEVQVFARATGDGWPEYHLERAFVEGVPLTRITHNFRDVDSFERLFSNPSIDAAFDRFLRRETPRIVHFHHLSGLSVSMIEIAKARGCRVVSTLHDYWLQCPRGQRVYPENLEVCKSLDRKKCLGCLRRLVPELLPSPGPGGRLRRLWTGDPGLETVRCWEAAIRRWLTLCDVFIAPSEFVRKRFVEWGLPVERCHVLPHGLPREGLEAEPRGDRPVRHLGTVGTLIPTKGTHILLQAFNLLGRPELDLHVHGAAVPFFDHHTYLDELRAMVRPGLDVRFHGRYEHRDLPRILASLDLLIVPSLFWESFCLTAREGALAGLPVIASELGGLSEAVEQGLALGFEAGNAHALAEAIDRVCSDPKLRDTLSRQGDKVLGINAYADLVGAAYTTPKTVESLSCK